MQRFPTLFAFEAKTSVGLCKCPFDGTNYMAIGGVSPANIREFFDAGCISVGLASSLMPKEAVAANDWEACAAYVRGMVDQIRR